MTSSTDDARSVARDRGPSTSQNVLSPSSSREFELSTIRSLTRRGRKHTDDTGCPHDEAHTELASEVKDCRPACSHHRIGSSGCTEPFTAPRESLRRTERYVRICQARARVTTAHKVGDPAPVHSGLAAPRYPCTTRRHGSKGLHPS